MPAVTSFSASATHTRVRSLVDALPLSGAVAWVLMTGLLTIRVGLNHEEFRDLQAFRRTAEGLIMGRDFNWGYGPLGLYVFTGLLRPIGFEVLAYRAFAMLFVVIGVCLAYRVARDLLLPSAWAGLAAALAFSLFSFPAYTYNHWLTTLANLASIVCVQRAAARGSRVALVAAGTLVGLSVLVKPIPIGFGAALAMILYLALAHRVDPALDLRMRAGLGPWVAGFACVVVPPTVALGVLAGVTRIFPAGLTGRVAESYVPPRLAGLVPLRLLEIDWQREPYALAREAVLVLNQSYGVLLFWGGFVYLPALTLALVAYRVGRRTVTRVDGTLCLLALMTVLAGSETLLTGTTAGIASVDAGYIGSAHSVGAYTLPFSFILAAYWIHLLALPASAGRHRLAFRVGGWLGVALVVVAIALPNARVVRGLVEQWPAVALPGIQGLRVSPDTEASTISALEFLRAHTRPTDTIWVTTYAPIFPFVSGRQSVVPEDDFVVHFNPDLVLSRENYPGWSGPPMRARDFVLRRVEERRPAAVVVGDVHGRSPNVDPRLQDYLRRHYARARVFEDGTDHRRGTTRRERWEVYLSNAAESEARPEGSPGTRETQ